MRITKMIAGIAGILGLVMTGFVASSASASPPSGATVQGIHHGNFCEQSDDAGENGAKTCWRPVGDSYAVCDIDHDDAKHAWGRVKWRSPNGVLHKSPVVEDGGDNGCNGESLHIREDRVITVVSCVQNGAHGKLTGCDHDRGWSGNS